MGQTNINTPSSGDGGFGAGMIVGIILLILVVLVLVVYAGPKIFVSPTNTKSLVDLLQAIAA